MANRTYAIEWLEKAYHDLDSANILRVSGHYTDTIGYLYHQAIEKMYKSILAFDNKPINKSHNLIELNETIDDCFVLNEDDIMTLALITTYNTKQRYPSQNKQMPTTDEINKAMDFALYLLDEVLSKLNIEKSEIICIK
jgi:HEPN domain-containing protein